MANQNHTPRPQATTQAELQSQIDSLNSDVYDCLTLNLSLIHI